MTAGAAKKAPLPQGVVTFNVRGQRFEVLPELILGKPETLLAQLLLDVGTDMALPIFVDANARRFEHILDWYRYGKMFVPEGPALDAVLQDAAFFLLPETVVVNGHARVVAFGDGVPAGSAGASGVSAEAAKAISENYINGVIREWSDFEALFADILSGIRAQVTEFARCSGVEHGFGHHHKIYGTVSVQLGSLEASLVRRCRAQVFNEHRQRAILHKLRLAGFTTRAEHSRHAFFDQMGSCVSVPIDGSFEPTAVLPICPFSGLPVCAGNPKCNHGVS